MTPIPVQDHERVALLLAKRIDELDLARKSAALGLAEATRILAEVRAMNETSVELKNTLVSNFLERIRELSTSQRKKSESVVELMITARRKSFSKATGFLLVAFVVQTLLIVFKVVDFSIWPFVAIVLLGGALNLNQAMLEIRVRGCYYGGTDSEARDILQFIFENADHEDFGAGSGIRRIVPEPESETSANVVFEGDATT